MNQPAFQELIYSDYYVQCTKFKVSFNQQFVPISLQFRLLFSWWFKFISSSEGVSVYIWFHNDSWIIFPMLINAARETYRGIEFVCWQNYGYNSTAAGGVVFPSLVIYSSLSAGHSQLEMKLVADRGTEFWFKWTIWDSWKKKQTRQLKIVSAHNIKLSLSRLISILNYRESSRLNNTIHYFDELLHFVEAGDELQGFITKKSVVNLIGS
jgi:hypothetical protein